MTELERARQVIDEALKKAGHVGPLRMRTAFERVVRADERAKRRDLKQALKRGSAIWKIAREP